MQYQADAGGIDGLEITPARPRYARVEPGNPKTCSAISIAGSSMSRFVMTAPAANNAAYRSGQILRDQLKYSIQTRLDDLA
jgi:hypothetical protein